MDPDERQRFIQILEEDEDTIQNILNNGCDDGERKNIALRLWTGCLCAAKECRRNSVAEHNPDGTTKSESQYTPEMFLQGFTISIICEYHPTFIAKLTVWLIRF